MIHTTEMSLVINSKKMGSGGQLWLHLTQSPLIPSEDAGRRREKGGVLKTSQPQLRAQRSLGGIHYVILHRQWVSGPASHRCVRTLLRWQRVGSHLPDCTLEGPAQLSGPAKEVKDTEELLSWHLGFFSCFLALRDLFSLFKHAN